MLKISGVHVRADGRRVCRFAGGWINTEKYKLRSAAVAPIVEITTQLAAMPPCPIPVERANRPERSKTAEISGQRDVLPAKGGRSNSKTSCLVGVLRQLARITEMTGQFSQGATNVGRGQGAT